MIENPHKTTQLYNLIGGRVRYQGGLFEIIEFLEDGPALVLQDCESNTTIQADQHGEAHRRVPHTFTLPVVLTASGEIDSSAIGIDILENKKN